MEPTTNNIEDLPYLLRELSRQIQKTVENWENENGIELDFISLERIDITAHESGYKSIPKVECGIKVRG